MKIWQFVLFCFLQFVSCIHASDSQIAVTYNFSGGRFGDNLLAFSHAKWIAYLLDAPMIYRSFPYSDQLKLSQHPSVLHSEFDHQEYIILSGVADYLKFFRKLNKDSFKKTILEVPYYPETPYEYDIYPYFPMNTIVDWNDSEFISELKELISPLHPLSEMSLPKDRLTVAMHMRTGVNYDTLGWQLGSPLKGPPESYYIDALTYLVQAFNEPMYVFIFTDHPDPSSIKKKFSQIFQHRNIVFDCRKSENRQDLNVIEDFFAMEQFDCLIRSESNFSSMIAKLFSYTAVVAPTHFTRLSGDQILIDRMHLELNPKNKKLKKFIETEFRL